MTLLPRLVLRRFGSTNRMDCCRRFPSQMPLSLQLRFVLFGLWDMVSNSFGGFSSVN